MATKIEPKNPHGWIYKGYALFDLRKYHEAVECFDYAIELQPKYADAWNNRGYAVFNLEKYQEAVECFDNAIDFYRYYRHCLGNDAAETLGITYRLAYALNCRGVAFSNLNTGKEETKKYFEETKKYFEEAKKIFKESKNKQPEALADVLHNLGYVQGKWGEYEESLASFNEAIETRKLATGLINKKADAWRNKEKADDWRNKGFVLAKLKYLHPEKLDYSEGEIEDCFEKAIKEDPNFVLAWNSLGYYLNSIRKYDEAVNKLNTAIELDRDQRFPFSYYNKGYALYSNGRSYKKDGNLDKATECFNGAIECFEKAVEIDPNFDYAWYMKGATLNLLKRYNEAIKCFDKDLTTKKTLANIEIQPTLDNVSNNKGYALYRVGRYVEAIECFDKAIIYAREQKQDDYDSWYNKGLAQFHLEHHDEAIKCFSEAIRLKPDKAIAYLGRGQAKYMRGEYSGALKDFGRIQDEDFKGEMHNNVGLCFYKLNLIEEARTEYFNATNSNSESTTATAYYNLGVLYNHENKVDTAKKMFESCLNTNPNFYKAREALWKVEKITDRSNWFEWWFSNRRVPKPMVQRQGLSLRKGQKDKPQKEDKDKTSWIWKDKGKSIIGLALIVLVVAITIAVIMVSYESPNVVAGLAGTLLGLVAILVGMLLIPTLGRLKAGPGGVEFDTERVSIEPSVETSVETTEFIKTTMPLEPSTYPVESFAAPLQRPLSITFQQPFIMPLQYGILSNPRVYPEIKPNNSSPK